MDRPPSRKRAKAPESVVLQRFPALIVSSHAGGHWFESSSLHQKIQGSQRSLDFFICPAGGGKRLDIRPVFPYNEAKLLTPKALLEAEDAP